MKTSDFLDILEHRKLAPTNVIAKLRAKAEKDQHRVTPQAILKYLVKKEIIPRSVAYQLLKTTLTVSSNAESSIMGFVPLPETPLAGQETSGSVLDDDVVTLAPVDSRQNLSIDQIENAVSASSDVRDEAPDPGEPDSPHLSSLASMSSVAKAQEDSEAVFDEIATEPTKSKPKRKKQKNKNEWDSSLILYGGGGLLVLIISGVVIYYLLNRENADLVLQQAGDYFDSGSYTQAISQYEHFLEVNKGHPQYSDAKVKLGMARLWKDSGSTSDYENALETVQSVLDDIQDEPEFRSAQRDLASLIPKIAQGLAGQAEEATEPELAQQRVEQTRAALSLAMNTKYIPKQFRDEVQISEIEQSLLRVERARQQNLDLAETLEKVDKALAEQDIAAAYELHGQLLEKHPALMRDDTLAAKVKSISEAEAQAIKFVSESREAESGPRQNSIVATLTLADQQVKSVSEAEGTLAIRLSGAVYALRASDGKLLWREYLGNGPDCAPIQLGNGDYLVTDILHREVARLEGDSGKVLWRLAFDTPLMQPVLSGEQIFVADQDGKLHVVEVSTGKSVGYIQFSQKLAVPPTIDESKRRLYVPGAHSSLYTISTDDYTCLGVYYLGHSADSIAVPVAKILNKVLVAVNTGLTTSKLSVHSISEKGLPQKVETEKRLTGTVDTPLLVDGRRLVVLTSLGQISAYDVASSEGDAALSRIAERDPEGDSAIARFGLLHDGNVWVGGRELSKLAILPTGNRIQVRNLDQDFAGDIFDNPLLLIDGMVVHVRRPADQAGGIVAAVDSTSGTTLWQTHLAVPLAGAPAIDPVGAQISAITATGAAYLLDREAMSERVQNKADRLSGRRISSSNFSTSVPLGQSRLAAGELGSKKILLFRPGVPRGPLSLVELSSPLSADLISWGEGFVAPTHVGQVYLFSSEDGEQIGSPFQPPLEANEKLVWLTPAVVSEGGDSQLVLSDEQNSIYLIQQESVPAPHLQAIKNEALGEHKLKSPIAVSGTVAIAGTKGNSVARFELPSLAADDPIDVGGQIVWGPFSTGSGFVFSTDVGEIVYMQGDGKITWKTPLGDRLPAGVPVADEASLLIAWQLHGISRLNLADGQELASVSLDQAIVAGPVPFGRRLVLAASDGTLLIVNQPEP